MFVMLKTEGIGAPSSWSPSCCFSCCWREVVGMLARYCGFSTKDVGFLPEDRTALMAPYQSCLKRNRTRGYSTTTSTSDRDRKDDLFGDLKM